MRSTLTTTLALLAVTGSALAGAGTLNVGTARLSQGVSAGPSGKTFDDNSIAGTTTLWTQGPYGLFDADIAMIRNSWSWRSPSAGGIAISITSTAGVTDAYTANTATASFTTAGTAASGLFDGSIKQTLTQSGANTALLKTELTVVLRTPPVGAGASTPFIFYNMIDQKINGSHNNDVLSPAVVSGTLTSVRATEGTKFSIHAAVSPSKYQGDAPGDLYAAGVFSGGNLANAVSSNSTDTATAFQWNLSLVKDVPQTVTAYFAVNTTAIPGFITACNKADITDGSGAGGPDGFLTGSDVVSFFSNFFAPCTGVGAVPCNKADITDGSGAGPADGFLTGSDVVSFFGNFFAPCNN